MEDKEGWQLLRSKIGSSVISKVQAETMKDKTNELIATLKKDKNLIALRKLEKIAKVDFKEQLAN